MVNEAKAQILFNAFPSAIYTVLLLPLSAVSIHFILTFFLGNYLNPLNVTTKLLPQISGANWTEAYISGKIKLRPIEDPKVIDSWSEIELPGVHSGWPGNEEYGLKHYEMTERLYSELCDSKEAILNQIKPVDHLEIVTYSDHGSNVIGGGNVQRHVINQTEQGLGPMDSLSFNTQYVTKEHIIERHDQNTVFVSSFLSNFPHPVLTSMFHASLAPSIAITCHGSKIWDFIPPRAMSKYGARGMHGAVILRGFDENEEQIVVKTKPGTILSFAPFWAHTVATYAGFSYVYTVRAAYPGNVKLNALMRIFTDRLSFFNALPSLRRSAFEDAGKNDDAADVYGNSGNLITQENLSAFLEVHETLVGFSRS